MQISDQYSLPYTLFGGRWNPAHFGNLPRHCEPNGQMTIFFDIDEPPDPDDYPTLDEYEAAWQEWESRQVAA
jgi:hypothetical protein